VATTRGYDIRDFALVVGGGAGPVHAAFIADLLHIPTVLIPPIASTYSAFGMFAMDVGRNYARSYITRGDRLDPDRVRGLYDEMEREATQGFAELGVAADLVTFNRSADLRYIGQFHEVEVEIAGGDLADGAMEGAAESFHDRHEALYTFKMPWQGIEFLTFRLRATIPKAALELTRIGEGSEDAGAALKRTRHAWFDETEVEVRVYDGALLRAGNRFPGPALIEETTTTVVVPPRYAVTVDSFKNYVLRRDTAATTEGELAAAFVTGGAS
jgi:N-methylhydantoinase A